MLTLSKCWTRSSARKASLAYRFGDGSSDPGPGASIECYLSGGALSDSVIVDYDGDAIVTKDITAALLVELARSFGPTVIEASPRGYSDTKAFLEKPGVGWMLYLPKLLQTRDVPEAEQLIPVRNNKGNSIGTVIVSVSDTVFSLDNPTHLEIAHSIEARLISNGWLPSYVDISRS